MDEYNRRYDARDNEFVMDNDTLYIKEKSNPDLDGEWVTGELDGTQEDYEYAERIIRFRNPVMPSASGSPLYLGCGLWLEFLGFGTCIPTDYMHMLSLHSPTACGGIGAITLMVGAVILTMAGDGTAGTVRAGALAGAAGTAVAGGDIIDHHHYHPGYYPGGGGHWGGGHWGNAYTNRRSYGPSRSSYAGNRVSSSTSAVLSLNRGDCTS